MVRRVFCPQTLAHNFGQIGHRIDLATSVPGLGRHLLIVMERFLG
jgi:hypothetical protein